jgi:hypothetical protein
LIFRKGFGRFKHQDSVEGESIATFVPRLPWRQSELAKFERSIPRYQKVLFYLLLAGIVLMAFFLVYERTQARDRLAAQSDATPLSAPVSTGTESFTLDLANDGDGSVTAVQRQIALPLEPSVRARALLERLMAEYALPDAKHPLASGAAVDDVFLLKLPIAVPGVDATTETNDVSQDGELAVVNLRSSFVNQHPSGVAVEMLTVLSMIGTLHANFSEITQVRFVVDGQPKETLAGHVDLTRVYPAIDTTLSAAQLQPAGGSQ